ncbi:hypothetical protein C1645_807006 [Glomus cerebriforme]|uniref:Uncharacterized protein n=1 Tax=Glomus cerebriforme TaxID=658196 RepID=A0A397SPD3_9GLOM|nr:hypothetical protein C1645_807006 [Glomus cerebriforme]
MLWGAHTTSSFIFLLNINSFIQKNKDQNKPGKNFLCNNILLNSNIPCVIISGFYYPDFLSLGRITDQVSSVIPFFDIGVYHEKAPNLTIIKGNFDDNQIGDLDKKI